MAFEQFLKKPRYSAEQYLHMLRKLLPNGRPWGLFAGNTDDVIYDTFAQEEVIQDSYSSSELIYDTFEGVQNAASTPFGIWLSVLASEFERLEIRAYDLVREMVPGLSSEMLPEWYYLTVRDEYEAALVGDDINSQRVLAHGKIFDESQVTTANWFEDYGETLGFDLTVNESPYYATPFIVGIGRCGERLGSPGARSIVEITVNGSDPGANYELMQALFARAKPAHVFIVWIIP